MLKLAEYKDRKFKSFLELGRDFGYFGNFIQLTLNPDCLVNKDKKDPLNYLNGLFDGRTYGEGRFVLIRGYVEEQYNHCLENQIIWEDELFKFDSSLIKEEKWKSKYWAENLILKVSYGNANDRSIRVISSESSYFDWRNAAYAGFYTHALQDYDEAIMASLVDMPDMRRDNFNKVGKVLIVATPSNCQHLIKIGNLHENPELHYNKLKNK